MNLRPPAPQALGHAPLDAAQCTNNTARIAPFAKRVATQERANRSPDATRFHDLWRPSVSLHTSGHTHDCNSGKRYAHDGISPQVSATQPTARYSILDQEARSCDPVACCPRPQDEARAELRIPGGAVMGRRRREAAAARRWAQHETKRSVERESTSRCRRCDAITFADLDLCDDCRAVCHRELPEEVSRG